MEQKSDKLETFEVEAVKHRGGLIATAEETSAVKGMYPAPHIHEHLRYTNGYGKLRTSSRTT